jgi:hypothetical protein
VSVEDTSCTVVMFVILSIIISFYVKFQVELNYVGGNVVLIMPSNFELCDLILTLQCFLLFYIYLLRETVLVRCKFIITHYFIRISSTSRPITDDSVDSYILNNDTDNEVVQPEPPWFVSQKIKLLFIFTILRFISWISILFRLVKFYEYFVCFLYDKSGLGPMC